MKVTVDGLVVEGTEAEIARLISELRRNETGNMPIGDPDTLTPKQRIVYDALRNHPNGAHFSILAEELGLPKTVTNGRLQELKRKGVAVRLASGVFRTK